MTAPLYLAILNLLQAGLTVVPEVLAAAQTEQSLLTSGTAPTPEQQLQIDTALAQAHQALQAA